MIVTPLSPILACAPNFRDVGAIATQDGRQLPPAKVYRSDMISDPDDEDCVTLRSLEIGLVIDLRSAHECASVPSTYWGEAGAEILNFDIGTDVRARGGLWEKLRADTSVDGVTSLMQGIYRSIPGAVAPALATSFDRLIVGAPVCLVHCTAGKDRTGVFIALLLHALGVPFEAIQRDYLETSSRVTEPLLAKAKATFVRNEFPEFSDEALMCLMGVRADYLAQSLSAIDAKFGGVDHYLEHHCRLPADRRSQLRDQMLV